MNFRLPRLPASSAPRLAVLGAALAALASASAMEITLPPETALFKPAAFPGYSTANAYCVVCHSADYILTQPPLPAAAWKAEVTKMKKVYGAPLPDDQIDPIADYLFRTYGTGKSRPAAESPPPPK